MLNSSLQRPMKRHQRLFGVCYTCGAVGRELQAIPVSSHYLYACSFLSLSKEDVLCFECRAMLQKFNRFRLRAKRVKSLMECASYNPKIQCLSTLTQTVISPNDAIHIDGDLGCVKVKEEMPDLQSVIDKLEKPWPDGNFEQATYEVPLSQAYSKDEYKWQESITITVEGTRNVPEPIVDVKGEMVEPNVGPMLLPKLGVPKISKKHPMSGNDNDGDDSDTDTASEVGDEPQVEQSRQPYTMTRIDQAEVLSQMERARGAERYRHARFKCDQCAVIIRSQPLHRAHARLHCEKQGRVVCPICLQRFQTRQEAQPHIAMHYCRFDCAHCKHVEYGNRQKMEYHFQTRHNTEPRYCRRCQARFTAHTKVPPRLECGICHRKYKGEQNLRMHVWTVHERPQLQQNNENAYCVECDKKFPDIETYRTHLKSAKKHSTNRFECDYCGKTYRVKGSLMCHITQTHTLLKLYKCHLCSERFLSTQARKSHRRRRHGIMPPRKTLPCRLCEKTFTVRKCLDQHMNTHLGIRPYECKLCDVNFAYSAALYNHNRLVHLKTQVTKKKSNAASGGGSMDADGEGP